MKAFDLSQIKAFPYEKREKNVLFQTEEFKTRIIELPPGGENASLQDVRICCFHCFGGRSDN